MKCVDCPLFFACYNVLPFAGCPSTQQEAYDKYPALCDLEKREPHKAGDHVDGSDAIIAFGNTGVNQ